MARGIFSRSLTVALLIAAETAVAATLAAVTTVPASAQFFDDRFPFQSRRQPRGLFDWFGGGGSQQEARPAAPQVDYSRAPAAKQLDPKAEAAVQTHVMVFGDAMADWLSYGLEQAYVDTPEVGIQRRHRTLSGLIRTEVRNDPRGEYPDWPQTAREIIAAQKPKIILMMIGINDRRQIRETAPAAVTPPTPVAPPGSRGRPAPLPQDAELEKAPEKQAADPIPPGGSRTYEFRTDAWADAYIKRIDDTIAALKTSNVPVFWVGLPPLRGQRATADITFLNDLYRSRADKAGIIYIDVWDGFVDEAGNFAQFGPDVEGQTRRLRAGDGTYFTQFGARKLAHYVERELQRWLTVRPVTAALPGPEETPKVEAAAPANQKGKADNAAEQDAPAVGSDAAAPWREGRRSRRTDGRKGPARDRRCDGREGTGEG